MWVDSILGLVAPPLCKGCHETSSRGLCDACLETIIDEGYPYCAICNNLSSTNNLCKNCCTTSIFSRIYVTGENTETLKKLTYDYKLLPERHIAKTLANILDQTLPILPSNTIIIPIPTIPNHIRQRGFGHVELVAKLLARKRRLPYHRLLYRSDNAVLHNLTSRERKKAADTSFAIRNVKQKIDDVLLIDDIYTTGSTTHKAAQLLADAGAKSINLAIIARHSKK